MATLDPKRPGRERAEVRRRAELIGATIAEIGATGTLDVTVGRIAKRAGISPALAFHYFGDKESLFLAAMRDLLTRYGQDVRRALAGAEGPAARVEAIVRAGFSPANFEKEAVAAWLNFYVLAQRMPAAKRLLAIYRRRLSSNLSHALRPVLGAAAPAAAERLAGLIDGLYLHAALDAETSAEAAVRHTLSALSRELGEGA